MRSEKGFTLIEVLTAMALSGLLLTLGVIALRVYWRTQQIEGASQDLVSQLRQVQQRTDAESHPLVYGVRFQVGTPNWAVIKYDPKSATTTTDDVCTVDATRAFEGGVTISAASFNAPTAIDSAKCPSSTQSFVFFYARGTATKGTVTLSQAGTGKTRTITVLPLTGRVKLS